MSTVAREVGYYLAEQLPKVADELTSEMFFAFLAMRDERDAAQMDNAVALARVERMLDHAPEECDCDHDGRVCFPHALVDDLTGKTLRGRR